MSQDTTDAQRVEADSRSNANAIARARIEVEGLLRSGGKLDEIDKIALRVLLAATALRQTGDYGKRCPKCGHYLAIDTRNADELCWCSSEDQTDRGVS